MASEAPEAPSGSHRPKVIYVMGAGRSGSTIVGVTLGNCDGVFFAGELDKWLARGGEPKLEDAWRVEFWERVSARVADPEVVRKGHAHRYLERSSGLLRPARLRRRRRLREPYRRMAGELYEATAATAATACLVDTSHYPLRARELQSLTNVDLYLLLLVRDPEGVVASFAKDDVAERRFSPLTTRVYLLLTYLLSGWVFLRHPRERRAVLFYEDLLDDPDGVVRDLLNRVGCPAEPPDFSLLSTGIPLHANRLIAAPTVALAGSGASVREGSFAGRAFARLLLAGVARLRPRVSARSAGAGSVPRAPAPPR
jgi:hypothetical protein